MNQTPYSPVEMLNIEMNDRCKAYRKRIRDIQRTVIKFSLFTKLDDKIAIKQAFIELIKQLDFKDDSISLIMDNSSSETQVIHTINARLNEIESEEINDK